MKELAKWIKKVYKMEELVNNHTPMWCISSMIVGFVYKNSYFCEELRNAFKYTSYTFQYALDQCNFDFEGNIIEFNGKIGFNYYHLRKFLWLFNPKYAILEVCLDKSVPMIVSAPDIPFEMVLSPRVKVKEDVV